MGSKAGYMLIIIGCVAMVVDIVMFGVGIQQLDTAYTSAAAYTEMTSLTSVMGVFGMVIFLMFMGVGLAALGAGTYMNVRQAIHSDLMGNIWVAVMGGISLVIALIMNTVGLTQLHAAYVIANATVNKAEFVGLLNIMGIFGIVIFIALIGAGFAQIGGGIYGGAKSVLKG